MTAPTPRGEELYRCEHGIAPFPCTCGASVPAPRCQTCGMPELHANHDMAHGCIFTPPNAPTAAEREGEGEELARQFHEAYERLAPSFGYETRKASAKQWAEVPEQNKRLMIAVCTELLSSSALLAARRENESLARVYAKLKEASELFAMMREEPHFSTAELDALLALAAADPETRT